MAQYFEVHPENPQPRLLKQAVALLEKGGILAVPTDSSYALVCHLDDKAAADAALVRMQQRGWSNARLSPPSVTPQYWLRIDRADAAQRERLLGLLPALPGAGLRPGRPSRINTMI